MLLVPDGRLKVHVAVRLDDAGRVPRLHFADLFFWGGGGVFVCMCWLVGWFVDVCVCVCVGWLVRACMYWFALVGACLCACVNLGG